ncbi:hypothetical protein [Chryseobacterium sp. MFBS3-17]|uniref:hypothetical protein n=1 Tax=Chryseobacterium sp. MFBS3-17 TaxID=2886689 RepID=UPI001D0F1AC3|nr:hypothetical protein [Chryseobacterium sp. MFBS3-17]MCC2590202.1 hypothetical protein [Chryseobacterium sp. MFBS3-17]
MKTTLFTIILLVFAGMAFGQETLLDDKMYLEKSLSYKDVDIDPNKVLRIESELSAFWKGVSSCGDKKRLVSNTDEAAQKWIKDKLYENRYAKLVRFGWYYKTPKITNKQEGFPNRVRSCTGLVKFIAFIEFEK